MKRLKVGEKFYMPGTTDVWEVLDVDDMAARVRPTRKRKRSFETCYGEEVEFEQASGGLLIASNSDVDRVELDVLDVRVDYR